MKTRIPLYLALLLIPIVLIAAEILRTDTGFYYPANKKHQDSIYFAFGEKNPFFGNACHLANDYNLAVGSPVYATGSGVVEQASTNIPFYGSDSGTPGGAIIVKHTTSDDTVFYALYGHINNFTVNVGDAVTGGQKIAEVAQFLSGGNPLSHLHFGINPGVPSFEGYTPTAACTNFRGYVDPEQFITTHSAKLAAAETCQAKDDTASTTKNTIVTIPSVLANDSDVDNDTLSVSAADANSANGVVITNNNDGTFTYTPAIDFVGTDSFNYSLTDSNGCTDQAKVTITVNADGTITNSSSGGGSLSILGILGLLSLLLVQVFRKQRTVKLKEAKVWHQNKK